MFTRPYLTIYIGSWTCRFKGTRVLRLVYSKQC